MFNVYRMSVAMCLTSAVLAPCAHAGDFDVGANGITIKSDDGDSELRIGGRLHYDVVRFREDVTPLDDQNDFRRARIALSGRFAKDWRFRVENDFGGSSQGWKSLWLAYDGFEHWDLRAGHLVAPVGMEQQSGSNDTPLMERSMASALSPGFLLGAQATYARKGWTGTLGYYGNPIDSEQDSSGQDGHGVAGRATWAPLRGKGRVLHLGTSFERRSVAAVAAPGGYRISARPGVGLSSRNLIGTGAISGVDRTDTWGVEVAGIVGPVTLQAERLRMSVGRKAGRDLSFSGWQTTGSWMLTGESRRYNEDTGVIGGIRPERRWGALELAVRYDHLDLEDGDVTGGRERNLAYGLNWYYGENFRLMYNHINAKAEPNNDGLRESVGIDEVRAQIDF
jgi:phosphate-selective porin OprO and OprP